jgi:RNA polymerase sigma-70 factor, ECF subfamily
MSSIARMAVAVADPLRFLTSPRRIDGTHAETPEVSALVSKAQAGNREAYSELVAMYEAAAYRVALAALGVREDAEDSAQDGLVLAWQKLSTFRGQSTFRTWLMVVVWRCALDRRRRRKRWFSRASEGSEPFELAESVADTSADPERTAVGRDLARRVAAEIARLSPKLRDTLLLATSGEHSYEEVSQLLGIPAGTVKWRVSEARRLVRAAMESAQSKETR